MIIKKILLIFFVTIILHSCADYNLKSRKQNQEKQYYSSNGFALIYEHDHYLQKVINKKISNDDIKVMHNILKSNTPIKIINPENLKEVETKVHKKAKFPNIFNIVISKKIASILELDENNPYVEIIEVKKNKTFIAKKTNTFDEEKNVAETVPVNEIQMDDLTKSDTDTKNKTKKNYNYILVVSDFYYESSATSLMGELTKKTKINNFSVKKINDKKYRLFVGPFKNFNALKTTYISLNKLGFDNLNIFRE